VIYPPVETERFSSNERRGNYFVTLSRLVPHKRIDLIIEAFNLAEQYRVPVFVMGEEAVAHLRERMDVKPKVKVCDRVKRKGGTPFGTEEEDGVPPCPVLARRKTPRNGFITTVGHRKTMIPRPMQARGRINKRFSGESIVQTESRYIEDAKVVVSPMGSRARCMRWRNFGSKERRSGFFV
jgi:pyruvate/2-oxoacid:ferredoxin oxidoreductase alpha subunit